MKVFIGLLAALVALNGVFALPANNPSDDAEVISGPRRVKTTEDDSDEDGFTNFKGVVDTGSGYPFLQPHPPPFSFNLGFFDSFDDLFRRLRTNFWGAPSGEGASNESGSGGIGGFGGFGGLGGFGADGKKGNSTSTVKVVDGHKVEVNETVYGDSGETFRVRIVNIRPLESGEEVEETVKTNVADNEKPKEPVTSSPKVNNREELEDSDERREPLESDNEIRKNPNEQKTNEEKIAVEESDSALLPSSTIVKETTATTTTTPNPSGQDNRNDNLNAAFVSDNSNAEQNLSGNGNIEAETNKPTDQIDEEAETEDSRKMLENYNDETATATTNKVINDANEETEQQTTDATNDSIAQAAEDVNFSAAAAADADDDDAASAVQDASLTIENNEETETNDNFNESSEVADNVGAADGIAVETTRDERESSSSSSSSSSAFDEPNTEVLVAPNTSAIETFDDAEDADDVDSVDGAVVHVEGAQVDSARLRYANLKKEREHFASSSSSSSDDEGAAEPVEMNPTFNSEWEHLAEELSQTNDQNNDLSNDIDVYASVPVDLSNDIAVNDVAAAQADFPVNPDAEFIDVDAVVKGSSSSSSSSISSTMPQFEKLSVSTGYQAEPIVEMLAPAK